MQAITKQEVDTIKKRAKRGEITQALQALSEKHGEMLSPYIVVKEARNIESPLHTAFEWDDTKAAEKYRLMQARIILTTVKIEYMGEKQEAFFNATIEINGKPTRGYFPIERVMSDEQLHREVLAQAVRDLEYAEQKYNSLRELKGVINTKKLKRIKAKISQ